MDSIHADNAELMQMLMEKFRIVMPQSRRSSATCAELSITPVRFNINRQTIAELGYPENICMYVSNDAQQIVIQPCEPNDASIPLCKRDENGKPVVRPVNYISNKALVKNIRNVMGWGDKRVWSVPAVRCFEGGILLFDLTKGYMKKTWQKSDVTSFDDVVDGYPSVSQVISSFHQVALAPPKDMHLTQNVNDSAECVERTG